MDTGYKNPFDKRDQIRIIQSGAEVFACDTILWPDDVFAHPIVYTACAMNADSYDSSKIGWKWISREQFEWLVRHYSCLVGYTLKTGPYPFYCHNHKCWERDGRDLPETAAEPEIFAVPDYYFEREI